MASTFTVTQDQLDQVFLNLEVVGRIRDDFEKEGNEVERQKYLFDYCGRLTVLAELGLLDALDAWRAKQAGRTALTSR